MVASDRRSRKTVERMKAALADLLASKTLADISVSELCRAANVSRATFYAHYDNVSDLYEQLVFDMLDHVQTFDQHFECEGDGRTCGARPYCEQIRDAGPYASVSQDPRFFSVVLDANQMDGSSSLKRRLLESGLPANIAAAVTLFQMSGCHAVAASDLGKGPEWNEIRRTVDQFIEGGIKAITSPPPPNL